MNKLLRVSVISAGVMLAVGCQQEAPKKETANEAKPAQTAQTAPTVNLDTDAAKQAYAQGAYVGNFIANQIKTNAKFGVELDNELTIQGFRDAILDQSQLSSKEAKEILSALDTQIRAKQQADRLAKAEENKKKGEAFLAENAKRPEVKTTDSGLQYEILEAGEGDSPAATDSVSVHYRGTLLNGEEFDASRKHGEEPLTFPLNGVIKGWTEGLQLMKPGAKYKFFIPGELAYGPSGSGRMIGPNETLIFDVELISVKGQEQAAAK